MGIYLQRYGYDAIGNILALHHQNRTEKQPGLHALLPVYETLHSNRLLARNRQSALATPYADVPTLAEHYHYNTHGSMTRMPHLLTMDWDFTEHLAHIAIRPCTDGPSSLEAWYRYDAQKQRSRKRVRKQDGAIEESVSIWRAMELYRRYGASGRWWKKSTRIIFLPMTSGF